MKIPEQADILPNFVDRATRKDKHVHKYQRFRTANGKNLWRCMLPGCNHSFYNDEWIAGKETVCWKCRETFRIPSKGLRDLPNQPLCDECWEKRKEKWRKKHPSQVKPEGLSMDTMSREELREKWENLPE